MKQEPTIFFEDVLVAIHQMKRGEFAAVHDFEALPPGAIRSPDMAGRALRHPAPAPRPRRQAAPPGLRVVAPPATPVWASVAS